MIRTQDAIDAARAKIGTPYGSGPGELDCINLIKHVIRTCPGGKPGYTTAGTNALWRSYDMSAKYRDLTWRQEGISGARAGMLAFKRRRSEGVSPSSGVETGGFPARTAGTAQAVSGATDDVHHAGIVTGAGTVIHASSARGSVVETKLTAAEGWNLLGRHRYIEVGGVTETDEAHEAVPGTYIVCAQGGLRQRETPGGRYMQTIPDGARITITQTRDGWGKTVWRGHAGWVSLDYLCEANGDD